MSAGNAQKPAYPLAGKTHSYGAGLTKREYIAALALSGMLADSEVEDVRAAAASAVFAADALLEALDAEAGS